jgi:hypothetical protein
VGDENEVHNRILDVAFRLHEEQTPNICLSMNGFRLSAYGYDLGMYFFECIYFTV